MKKFSLILLVAALMVSLISAMTLAVDNWTPAGKADDPNQSVEPEKTTGPKKPGVSQGAAQSGGTQNPTQNSAKNPETPGSSNPAGPGSKDSDGAGNPGKTGESKNPGAPAAPNKPTQSQRLNGKVIQAKGNKITINIGAADGVKPGTVLTIKRNNSGDGPSPKNTTPRVAEIKVVKIQKHSTDCQVIKWFTPQHKIRPGDKAEGKI